MLSIFQFPIADLRPFIDVDEGQLPVPGWPPRAYIPREFLRHFGPAIIRRLGVDSAWTDEYSFCKADRALRFVNLHNSSHSGDWKNSIRCAFRRMLSDGQAVSRVEVGFGLNSVYDEVELYRHWNDAIDAGDDPAQGFADVNPIEIVQYLIDLPTIVPVTQNNKMQDPRPLIQQGNRLARLYANATTKHTALKDKDTKNKWVKPGAPVSIIECHAHHIKDLPKGFVHIDPVHTGGVDAAFGRVNTNWGQICLWVLGHGHAKLNIMRSLRICLLRLHAEQEVLDIVLDYINSGSLQYEPSTSSGDRLENYLNNATRLIEKAKWSGVNQTAIISALDAFDFSINRDMRKNIKDRLSGARRQIIEKVERFNSRSYINADKLVIHSDSTISIDKVNHMTQNKVINIGNGASITAPVFIADTIQDSFNIINNSNAKDEVKELMRELLEKITEATNKSPDKVKNEKLADNAERLAQEVTRNKPSREWYEASIDGIKDAATALGDIGGPIIETTKKLLPLLISLFP